MLVLSRKLNEKIVLPGCRAAIQVVSIRPGVVRLGIEAPPEVVVLREEVPNRTAEWGPAMKTRPAPVPGKLHSVRTACAALRRQLEAGRLHDAETTLDQIDAVLGALRLPEETDPSAAEPRKSR